MATKKNYNKITTEKPETEEAVIDETVKEEVNTETVDETPEKIIPIGVVVNCTKLNVRKKPDVTSDPACTIDAGVEVKIIDSPNNEFYKVELKNGKKGYCMKKYIKIK